MSQANQVVEGVKFLAPGGINERMLPELISEQDFSFLQGLVPRQIGELKNIPGKGLLSRVLQGQTVLSLTPFGNYILVQTNTNLVRFSNFELFGGIDFTQNLTPDTYPTSSSEEEAMAQIILEYNAAAGNAGTGIANGVWTLIPLNQEVRDTGGNCVLAANSFALTAGAYPKNCRIKVWCNAEFAGAAGAAQARLGLFIPATSTTVPIITGLNQRFVSAGGANRAGQVLNLEYFFVLTAATTYDLRVYANAGNFDFGTALTIGGLIEKYCSVEILIE